MGNIFQWQLRLPLKTEGIIGGRRFINKEFAFTIAGYQLRASITVKIINSETLCEYVRTERFIYQNGFLDLGIRGIVVFKNEESVVVVIGTDNFPVPIAVQVSNSTARKKRRFPNNLVWVPARRVTLNKKSSLIISSEYFGQPIAICVIYCPRNEFFEIR